MQEIAGVVPEAELSLLVTALGVSSAGGKATDATPNFDKVKAAVEKVVRDGFSATQLLSQVPSPLLPSRMPVCKHEAQLHDVLILDPALSARTKAGIAMAMGEADKCLTDGADEELQLLNLCLRIRKAVAIG